MGIFKKIDKILEEVKDINYYIFNERDYYINQTNKNRTKLERLEDENKKLVEELDKLKKSQDKPKKATKKSATTKEKAGK